MIVSITDFGAIPNIIKDQTSFVQKAIDYCFANGGGTVTVPRGVYTIGSIRLRSNVTLKLLKGSTLSGSRNTEDYKLLRLPDEYEPIPEKFLPDVFSPRSEESLRHWHYALIHIYRAENVTIIGEEGSLIEGNNVFDPLGEEGYRGPHAVSILYSQNITLQGYTIKDSSNWAHNCWLCKNLTFENLTVYGGHDGIDFFGSDNVTVKNCKLLTGDDCIAGFDNQFVNVSDCTINSSCSGFRFSGTHVKIERCTVYGPGKYVHRNSLSMEEKQQGKSADGVHLEKYRNNMLSFFTYYADHRLKIREAASDIVIENCTIKDCDRFLLLKYGEDERWQCNKPLLDIFFKNITGSGVKIPITLRGDCKNPVSLFMENCKVDFNSDFTIQPLIKCANCKLVSLKNVYSNFSGQSLIISYGENTNGQFIVSGGNTANYSVSYKPENEFSISSI